MLEKAGKIKLLFLDVDGVLTDGRLVYGPAGEEHKCFHVHDGLGIRLLLHAGIAVAFATSRSSDALKMRAEELGVELLYQNVTDKLSVYEDILSAQRVLDAEVGAAGDDILDLPVLRRCGVSFAVANSVAQVKEQSDYVTAQPGGYGAVREICEVILRAKGLWEQVVAGYC